MGNGQNISPFEDQWILLMSNPLRGRNMNRMLPSMKVAQFIDHEHRCWRDNLIRLFFPDECSRHILSIHLPRGQCEDKLIW